VVQVVGDFAGCRVVKNELAVMIVAEVGDAFMDADAAGVGPFVEHFKMTETGSRDRHVLPMPKMDSRAMKGR
jgi:hypothetical protein